MTRDECGRITSVPTQAITAGELREFLLDVPDEATFALCGIGALRDLRRCESPTGKVYVEMRHTPKFPRIVTHSTEEIEV